MSEPSSEIDSYQIQDDLSQLGMGELKELVALNHSELTRLRDRGSYDTKNQEEILQQIVDRALEAIHSKVESAKTQEVPVVA